MSRTQPCTEVMLITSFGQNGVANRVTKLLHLEHQCLGEPPPLPQYKKSSTGNDNQASFSNPRFLNLISSGNTTESRSGLSLFLSSQHCKAILASDRVSSIGQSVTVGSRISENLPFSMAFSTWWLSPIADLAVMICSSITPNEYKSDFVPSNPVC
ncbi:hypothetical protein Dsin_014417 [Dipteronia sinensis]|uniref:Uncharacterized protein n=1 Tax=Dipteronia sinensis TaxID=43782 RepID=A0AAE0EAA4_9ROSI|nr:hypothetical protein Dsin_014417 [Dipteronia sinensis]